MEPSKFRDQLLGHQDCSRPRTLAHHGQPSSTNVTPAEPDKQAGFTSAALALRAEAIFTRGTDEVQTRVRNGLLSISAAYDELPKRSGAAVAPPTGASPPTEAADDEAGADDKGDAEHAPSLHGPTAAPGQANGSAPSDKTNEEPPPLADQGEDEGQSDDDGHGSEAIPLGPPVHTVERHEPSIGDHVAAICAHVGQVAASDYDAAIMWMDEVCDEMRNVLGDRPDAEYDEEEF